MQNAKCKIGVYLTVTTHYVILSEAALCAAKSKNPFSLRCFRGRILRLATLAQDDSVVITWARRFEQSDKLKFETQ